LGKSRSALEELAGIGPSLARDLSDLGFVEPSDLRGQDPEGMFRDLCALRRRKIDRCVLYAFRCAVYAASTKAPDPELLKWWNWKDRASGRR
jgi:hypothetical protein